MDKGQLELFEHMIREVRENKNYGKETLYAGMRDAFLKTLEQLQASRA